MLRASFTYDCGQQKARHRGTGISVRSSCASALYSPLSKSVWHAPSHVHAGTRRLHSYRFLTIAPHVGTHLPPRSSRCTPSKKKQIVAQSDLCPLIPLVDDRSLLHAIESGAILLLDRAGFDSVYMPSRTKYLLDAIPPMSNSAYAVNKNIRHA